MKFQECQHVLANGNTCRAPRLRNERFCYFHVAARDRLRRQRLAAERKLPLQLPVLEDESTIQLALGDVVNAMLADRIDAKKAALTLYALQTASANLKHTRHDAPETYTEYLPELDSALPSVEPPADSVVAPLAKPSAEAAPAKIPPKKSVAGVRRESDSNQLSRLIEAAKKRELRAIRTCTKALEAGNAQSLPVTIAKLEQDEKDWKRQDWGALPLKKKFQRMQETALQRRKEQVNG